MSAPRPPQAPASRPAKAAPPTGTLFVVSVLVLAISTLWMLVLGILNGRA